MEISDCKDMKLHDTSFRLTTRTIKGYERKDLYKVVDGCEELLIGYLESYQEGMDYLENSYLKDWDKLQRFLNVLLEEISGKIFLFDFDESGIDSCMRHIICEFEGKEIITEVTVVIETGFGRVMNAKADWIQVINDSALDELINRFSYDMFRILDYFLHERIVSTLN